MAAPAGAVAVQPQRRRPAAPTQLPGDASEHISEEVAHPRATHKELIGKLVQLEGNMLLVLSAGPVNAKVKDML